MPTLTEDARRDHTFWRGMYFISFVIGVVLPIASIITAGAMTDDGSNWILDHGNRDQAKLTLYLMWSAATLVCVLGTTSAAWIVIATGEKLGIDSSPRYLRGMFVLAIAFGGIIPVAALIAVGVMGGTMEADPLLLIIAWAGMLSVLIAGVVCAIWLVRTASLKIWKASGHDSRLAPHDYETQYARRGAADVH